MFRSTSPEFEIFEKQTFFLIHYNHKRGDVKMKGLTSGSVVLISYS